MAGYKERFFRHVTHGTLAAIVAKSNCPEALLAAPLANERRRLGGGDCSHSQLIVLEREVGEILRFHIYRRIQQVVIAAVALELEDAFIAKLLEHATECLMRSHALRFRVEGDLREFLLE